MGKHRIIDHRRPPPSAGIPQVLRQGQTVPANPVPEVATDEVVQLRRAVQTLQGRIERAEQTVQTRTAETKGLKLALQAARDETAQVRAEQQQPETEGSVPGQIEIITVDDISRQDKTATLMVLADLDGTIGETTITIPIDQLKQLIQKKKQNGNQRIKNMPTVRKSDETSDVSDRRPTDTEAGGTEVREVRHPPTRGNGGDG